MSDMLNHAITTGPVSLPDAVAMLDTAYLGHVIVLWSWALKQPQAGTPENGAASTTVRFRSLDGRDREIAVPRLTFTEPITSLAGATTRPFKKMSAWTASWGADRPATTPPVERGYEGTLAVTLRKHASP